METEEWKPVKNWEGYYEVSNTQKIKRLERKTTYIRCGKPTTRIFPEQVYDYSNREIKRDYFLINFKKQGFSEQKYLHVIVAEAFIINDDPKNKTQVNHKNGKKHCNIPSNLEWCTPSYNTQHAYNNGLAENSRIVAQKIHGKVVEQYTLDGNFIQDFPSVKVASVKTGMSYWGIWKNCLNRKTSYSGFIWKYKS